MANTPKLMAVQGAALLVAAAFVLAGVLGFVPGATTHLDQLAWFGHHSGAKLFGIFTVSALHNVLHLVFGAVGFLMARTYAASRLYLLVGGVVYLALWGYGMLIGPNDAANVMPLNDADNWLHFGLGIVLLLLGVTLAAQHDPTKPRPRLRPKARAKS